MDATTDGPDPFDNITPDDGAAMEAFCGPQSDHPGDREARGAIAGMLDLYGRPGDEPAIGDSIWFRLASDTYPRPGRLQEITDGGWLVLSLDDGSRVTISPDDVVRR